ncbi:uncharacterized protein [Palaemon carinicauda]|uniref:uncharacterized protein n=2 Tax=Palaemon carinicauda TaxID=392227 RepID=UPI0035B5A597
MTWFGLENKLVAYADDATLFASNPSPDCRFGIATSLNRDLVEISAWCKLLDMMLNPNKTLVWSLGRSGPHVVSYQFGLYDIVIQGRNVVALQDLLLYPASFVSDILIQGPIVFSYQFGLYDLVIQGTIVISHQFCLYDLVIQGPIVISHQFSLYDLVIQGPIIISQQFSFYDLVILGPIVISHQFCVYDLLIQGPIVISHQFGLYDHVIQEPIIISYQFCLYDLLIHGPIVIFHQFGLHDLVIQRPIVISHQFCLYDLLIQGPSVISHQFGFYNLVLQGPIVLSNQFDCISYGDCCLDAPTYNISTQIRNVGKSECLFLTPDSETYVRRNTCKREWENTTIASLCASASPSNISKQRDILLSFPVTSNATHVTYPNYYCAVCNDDTEGLQFWGGELSCVVRQEDMEDVLDFFEWKRYDSEYNNLLLNNGNVTNYIKGNSIYLYMMMLENVEVQNYIKSNLIFSEEDSSWVALVKHHRREIKLSFEVLLSKPMYARDCVKAVQSCPKDPKFEGMNDLYQEYVEFVSDFSNHVVYRNIHCAECNNVAVEKLECFYGIGLYVSNLFSLVLSVPSILFKIELSHSECGMEETFLPSFSSCQSTLCRLSNEIHSNGVCLNTKRLSSFYNSTNSSSKVVEFDGLLPNKSKKNLTHEANVWTCIGTWFYAEESDFMHYNNTISYPKENEEMVIDHKKYEGGYLVCVKYSIKSETLNWIAFACLIVSVCCLSLHLFTFIVLNSLRNLAGKNLASFAMCLLIAYVVFLASPSVSTETTNCYVTACLIYFSFFASFCWMNIIAFDTWDSFRTVTSRLYLRRGDQKKRFLLYSLYCWSLAVVAVLCLVVTDQTKPQGLPSYLYPSLGQKRCWFGHNMSLLMFFVAPSFVFILLNIFFFVSTAWNILGSKSVPEENVISLDRNLFKVHGRLAVLMSIAWVSGIIAYFVNDDIAWCIFIILTSLQGAFIFVAFTCNKTVWDEVLEVLGCSHKTTPKPKKNIEVDDDGNQQPYRTPRIELLHISNFIDKVHQPSRLAQ